MPITPKNREQFDRRVLLQLDNKEYEGLDISFKVTKTVKKALNKAKITVTNLPKSYEKYIGSRDLRIRLLAGYAGNVRLLFEGNPVENGITATRDGGESKVEFNASDGLRTYQKSKVSISFDKQTTFGEIIRRVIQKTDLVRGKIVIPKEKRMTQGVVLHGSTRKILDRAATAYNADWSIQNGKLNFLPRGETANQGSLFSTKLDNILEANRMDDGRLKLKTLLDHSAPGDRFKVEGTDRYDGVYKIQSAVYNGNTGFDDPFYSTFKATSSDV